MKLVLGSKSPRRQELLRDLGFEFEIRTLETDESFPAFIPIEDVAVYIAQQKAAALRHTLSKDEVILCADTVVTIDNIILGKPKNAEDAIYMLELLSGKEHDVITGVSLWSLDRKLNFSVCTKVHFHSLSREMISHYIKHYKPFDKAGAYGIQEWIGYTAVKKIEGSYTNVVGLPTHETFLALKKFQ